MRFKLILLLLFIVILVPCIVGTEWDVTSAVWLQSFEVTNEEGTPRGVFFNPNGTKMYIVGSDDDSVVEYDLDPAWNVTSAVYLQEFYVGDNETRPNGVFFNPNGTKMYIMGYDDTSVDEYDLDPVWNVTSAVYLQEFYVGDKETFPTEVFFKPDGTKMYTVGSGGDSVDEYDLDPAWNVTSAEYLQEKHIGDKETNPKGVFFKPDGTKMYVIGWDSGDVIEYDLDPAWNVTSAVYLQEFDVSGKETNPTGVFFRSDGLKMYTIGYFSAIVNEYNLPAAPVDTCTAPESGDWEVDCSDNCDWNSPQDVPGNVYMTGPGKNTLSSTFTFTGSDQYIYITDGCAFEIVSGGQIG